ncbi:hypothetical protein CDCA_CDCA08G2328 [Cyanidium caldarium]|uniref:Inositol-1-monophosphatase n=1 Tax=Cyanidium caldarium TaxID=2771 RepID=A0AAV9IW46_CYACA|nr:hypothetical protein CDCA_CDCA08G2328 [Cyanidium caldarium]
MSTADAALSDTTVNTVVEIAREAGEMIRRGFHKNWPYRTPFAAASTASEYDVKQRTDPVTDTDRAVEAHITRRLRATQPPSHRILGEESYDGRVESLHLTADSPPTWCIDPIDGTANFVHHIPHCAVSIGLAVGGRPQLGVIYNPILDEMFTARVGGGAYLNGGRIYCSGVQQLPDACVVTEHGSDRSQAKVDLMVEMVRAILRSDVQAVRCTGSAALNLAYVACGRFDVYVEWGPYPWDIAAGKVIVEEAGGVCLMPHGAPFVLHGRGILATNRFLVQRLRFRDGELASNTGIR